MRKSIARVRGDVSVVDARLAALNVASADRAWVLRGELALASGDEVSVRSFDGQLDVLVSREDDEWELTWECDSEDLAWL
jgi:hypothetical protein